MPFRAPPADMPAAPSPRKRAPWVAAPFAVAVLLFAGTSAAWFVERARLAEALDGAQAAARRAGVELSLGERRISGFPFRLRVAAGPVRVRVASGWAVETPALVAQAYVHAPLHWVLVAPEGLTVVRPEGGPLRVRGASLRASVAGVDRSPWRVSLVGDDVDISTPPGARPFSLQHAGRLGLYLKPADRGAGAGDGAVLLELERARATAGSLAWNLAPEATVDAAVEGRLTHLAAFRGADWGAAARAWRAAGGAFTLGHLEAKGGPTELWATGGSIGVGGDGRLAGAAPLRLRQSPQLIAGPAGAQTITVQPLDAARREQESARFDLMLKDGEVRLGPVRLGPSPKVG